MDTLQRCLFTALVKFRAKTALVYNNLILSYQELEKYSSHIARHLTKLGYEASRIALIFDNKALLIVSLLGVTFSRNTFVPISKKTPDERIRIYLKTANVRLILSDSDRNELYDVKNINVAKLLSTFGKFSQNADWVVSANPSDLSHIYFTSGSTGAPKGIKGKNSALLSFMQWMIKEFVINEDDRVIQLANEGFSLFKREIFATFMAGASLHIPSGSDLSSFKNLCDYIIENRITLINIVPSYFNLLLDFFDPNRSKVRCFFLAGEIVKKELLIKYYSVFGNQEVQLVNLYGPTETTQAKFYFKIKKNEQYNNVIPVGFPINESTKALIVGHHNSLLSQGTQGEIIIQTEDMSYGYCDERLNGPFINLLGKKAYKTGDRGFIDELGRLYVVGRDDHQIKIRGIRVELGEIEQVMSRLLHLRENIVLYTVFKENSQKILVAFMVGDSIPNEKIIRKKLANYLPDYMIPESLIKLDKLPRNINNKIDRKTLENFNINARVLKSETVSSKEDENYSFLKKCWSDILKKTTFKPSDDFFRLGGNSLLVMYLASLIQNKFSVKINYKDFFTSRTLAEQASLLGHIRKNNLQEINNVELISYDVVANQSFPITDLQQAYILGRTSDYQLGNIGTQRYVEYKFKKHLDVDRLNRAINSMIERHEMLRTTFDVNQMRQVCHEQDPNYQVELFDFSFLTEKEAHDEIISQRKSMINKKFDITQLPLFDIKISRSKHQDILHFLSDILIMDATSLYTFEKELSCLYQNKKKCLPKKQYTFYDYLATKAHIRQQKNKYYLDRFYWISRFKNEPSIIDLPLKRLVDTIKKPHFQRSNRIISNNVWLSFKAQADFYKVSPTSALLTIFYKTLFKFSGTKQCLINISLFNRNLFFDQFKDVIGDFTDTLIFQPSACFSNNFLSMVKMNHKLLWEDLEQASVSGVEVQAIIKNKFAMDVSTLIAPVVFTSIQGQQAARTFLDKSFVAEQFYLSQTSQVWLDNNALERELHLESGWDYVTQLFDEVFIERMHQYYEELIGYYAHNEWDSQFPDVMSKADLFIINQANSATQINSGETLVSAFNKSVDRFGNQIAVIDQLGSYTYSEIKERSDHIAYYLISQNNKDKLIAILSEKGYQQVIAAYGIMQCAAAYLPLNLDWPLERLETVLEQGLVQRVFISEKQWMRIKKTSLVKNYEFIVIEKVAFIDFPHPIKHRLINPRLQDIAYVIFTSGSTGIPKGVTISHAGVMNTIEAVNQRFNINRSDKALCLSEFSFDLSVYDIFGMLTAGATVVFPDQDKTKEPSHWFELVTLYKVTLWNSVPQLMQLFINFIEETEQVAETLKIILMSGDFIPLNLPHQIKWHYPKAVIMSLGGATEGSIWSIWYEIKELVPSWKTIPYGRAMPNQKMFILNEFGEHCSIAVTGEIHIGGKGVAINYWNDPEKTRANFISHPLLGKLYKTGDLGRLLADGNIEFIGRKDNQVKIAGYRIELGEIASKLRLCPEIADFVLDVMGENNHKQLIIYYIPKKNDSLPFSLARINIQTEQLSDVTINLKSPLWTEKRINHYYRRKSYRQFLPDKLALAELDLLFNVEPIEVASTHSGLKLDRLLSPFQAYFNPAEQALPKYLYPSAGSLYPVRIYISIADPDLGYQSGHYYYHPDRHQLIKIAEFSEKTKQKKSYPIHISFIAYLPAIKPIYKKMAEIFCTLEAGYMLALLIEQAKHHNVGLTSCELDGFLAEKDYLPLCHFGIQGTYKNIVLTKSSIYLILKNDETPKNYQVYQYDGAFQYLTDVPLTNNYFNQDESSKEILHTAQGVLLFVNDNKSSLLAAGYQAQLLMENGLRYAVGSCAIGIFKCNNFLKNYIKLDVIHSAIALGKVTQGQIASRQTSPSVQNLVSSDVVASIRSQLENVLPHYMVPKYFIQINEIPLTANGKVDRKALPSPDFNLIEENYVVPRTELELSLCAIWQTVLGVDRIGIQDDFFRIGGDSILAIQLTSKLRHEGLICNVKDIFEQRSIENLAKLLIKNPQGIHTDAEQGVLIGAFHLLPIQYWFFENVTNGCFPVYTHWNQAFLIKVPELDTKRLKQAINKLVNQHDMLRVIYPDIEQDVLHITQCYQATISIPELRLLDVSGLSQLQINKQLTEWQSHFKVQTGPLWQVAYLYGYSDSSARIFFALHHLISDRVTWQILIEDLEHLYHEHNLAKKTSSYRQWCNAVQIYAKKQLNEKKYWIAMHNELTDYYPIVTHNSANYQRSIYLEKDITTQLLQTANLAYHTEVNDLLLTALAYTLQDWQGGNIQAVTLEGHGRESIDDTIDISRTVGWFTTQYPVKLILQTDLGNSIKQIKENLRQIPNKGINYGVFRYQENSELQHYLLPPICFNYLGKLNSHKEFWQLIAEPVGKSQDMHNCEMNLIDITGMLINEQLQFSIVTQLNERITEKLTNDFKNHLKKIVQHCNAIVKTNQQVYTPSDFTTVKLSQAWLDKLQQSAKENNQTIQAIYPANSLQQGFIYHVLSQPDDDAYRVQLLYDYFATIDAEKLKSAWELAIAYYPVLRTAFNWEEEIVQIIYNQSTLNWTEHDISTLKEKDQAIADIQVADRNQPFDLSKAGLFRIHLIKQNKEHYILLLSAHHSILDGWSNPILLEKVNSLYERLLQNQTVLIHEEKTYLEAQQYFVKNLTAENHYWQEKIKIFMHTNDLNSMLSCNANLSEFKEIRFAKEQQMVLPLELHESLKLLARNEGITVNTLLQFAWHKIIETYTSDTQTTVGTIVSGRNIPIAGVENSVGLYINTLPLMIDWKNRNIRDQLKHIHQEVMELTNHSHINLAKLQPGGKRLFHSLFVYENYPNPEKQPMGLTMRWRAAIEKLDYPFAMAVYEQNGLHLRLKYAGEYLTETAAKQLLKQVTIILQQLVEKIDQPDSHISLLTQAEYQKIIYTWNQTEQDYPRNKTLQALFEAQANKTPDAIAVVCDDQSLTYAELNQRANQLARYIRAQYQLHTQQALQPDTLMGLCVERSLDMWISILAILKAGGAYVPIDPNYPLERIHYILEDTQAQVVLTQEPLLEKLHQCDTKAALIAVDKGEYVTEDDKDLPIHVTAKNLAYVIYTSGTTGKPKGVMVEHQGLVNLAISQAKLFKVDETSRVLQFASISFDVATFEWVTTLISGGSLYLVLGKENLVGDSLWHVLNDNQITLVALTPAVLATLSAELPYLKTLVIAGESSPDALLRTWYHHVKLFNAYGPTEATVYASLAIYNPKRPANTIGRPVPNTQLYILNQHLQPVPIGAIGELYIGGAGLARGYLNQPELTAERFIPNPFATEADKANGYTRLYKTGDLARYLADGNIEYIGRSDFQIKLRGYRIELGEIESVLSHYAGIQQVAVLMKAREGTKYLVAYYVAAQELSNESLQQYLSQQLPEYMVPSVYVYLPEFPLTVNGKLDRAALPEPSAVKATHYVAPRNAEEQKLCTIWEEVLKVKPIGITDDFFRVGGDSILSIQLSSRLRQAGIQISVKDIFDYRTIEKLTQHLMLKPSVTLTAEQGILTGTFNLLPIQSWFFERRLEKPDYFNQSFLVKVPPLSEAQLKLIPVHLAEQHDALRLRCRLIKGKWQQYYEAEIPLPSLKRANVAELSTAELNHLLSQWQSEFNIEEGPLWQIGYLTGYAEGSARLYFALHHLIVDTVSWRILIESSQALCEGKILGPKTSSYRQWVNAVAAYPQQHAEELEYWEHQVAKQPPAKPFQYVTPTKIEFKLSKTLTNILLQKANAAYHTEINDLLLTALAYSLQAWHGQPDSYISLEGHGREAIDETLDTSETVGWFTTLYPVCLSLKETLAESIKQIKESLRTIPNKGIGYGAFKYGESTSSLKAHPLPPISFNYLGQFDSQTGFWQLSSNKAGQTIDLKNHDENILDIYGLVIEGELRFSIASQLSKVETSKIQQAFQQSLERIIDHCLSQITRHIISFTSSDFTTVHISQAQLDNLQNQYEIEAIYPATSLQQGFIYHVLSQPDDDAYRVQLLWDYHNPMDVPKFKHAWELVIQCYPVLRAAFNWEEELIQIIVKKGQLTWIEEDISLEEDKEQAITAIQVADRKQRFDLLRPSLFRIHWIKQSKDHNTLLLSVHHSILDGWSNPILLNKVHEIYKCLLQNRPIVIQEERTYLQAQDYYAKNKSTVEFYWQNKIKVVDHVNDLNTLLSHATDLDKVKAIEKPKEYVMTLSNATYQKIKALSRAEGITLNILLQFAWHKLIQIYTGDPQTIVGTTVSGRNIPIAGIEDSIGLYINTLPLIVNWENKSIREQLKAIHKELSTLRNHSDINLASLQQGGKRLFHSLFVYENYPVPESQATGLEVQWRSGIETLDYPLAVVVHEQNGLHLRLKYAGEYLTETAAKQLLKQVTIILQQLVEKIDQPDSHISLLTQAEYQKIIYTWNQTEQDYPRNKTLQALFEAQANKTPDAIAVVCDDQSLTYAELNQRANQLARYIRAQYQLHTQQALQPDTLMGLCVERSLDMWISILAILKAGGAYVPIDPNYPLERIHYILEDTQTQVVLTQEPLLEKLHQCDTKAALIAVDKGEYVTEDDKDLPIHVTAKNLAYVIYTSGTTGKPKGVMVEHQGLVNLAISQAKLFKVDETSRVLQFASISFDVATFEWVTTLISGGSLYLVLGKENLVGDSLWHVLNDNQITLVVLTSTVLGTLSAELPYLKTLLVGSESSPDALLRKWYRRVKLFNAYGPTEATVYVSLAIYNPKRPANTIGRPVPNTQLYILNQHLQPVPIGAIGELYIGGAGLARGYLNQPELTAERFIPNPFATEADKANGYTRLYKTGDLARYLADGNIEYIGRSDFQIKLRGYRIELGEIESVLSHYAGIQQVAVLMKAREGTKYLVAYYVAAQELSNESLQQYLSQQLPEYMVPSVYVYLPEFPLTVNGKLDRAALPEPSAVKATHYVAPRNAEEQKLCTIWEEVLKVKPIGITDDFFRVGGDSILSIQLSSRLRQAGIQISVKDIFDYRTIEKLAKLAEKRNKPMLSIKKDRPQGAISLTPIQSWFFAQDFYNNNYFNQSICISLKQPNVKILNKALDYLIAHHDVFRMRFRKKNNQWQGYYLEKDGKTKFEYLEISEEKRMLAICNAIAAKFNLAHGPLYHFQLFKINEIEYKLYLMIHHLIVDGVSWRIITEDLSAIYQALLEKKSVKLVRSDSYQSWSNKLKDFLSEELNRVGLRYWLNYQVNLNTLDLSQAEHKVTQKGNFTFQLEQEESDLLLNKSPAFFDTDIKSIVLFPLLASLYDNYGKNDLIVTLEGHGRTDQLGIDISRTMGWFTNIYPVIFQFNSDINFIKKMPAVLRLIDNEINQVPDAGLAYFNALYHPSYRDKVKPAINLLFQQIVFNYLGKIDSGHLNTDWTVQLAKLRDMDKHNQLNSMIIVNALSELGKFKFSFDFQGLAKKEALILFETIQKYYDLVISAVRTKGFQINHQERFDNDFNPIITLNPFGRKKPLVVVHPGSSGYEAYLNNLCKALDSQRKLLMLNNYNLYSGKKKIESITELANKYLQLIKRYQPFGPYNLIGWSFGALLSYEIGALLEKQGDRVDNIFLMDPIFSFAIKDPKIKIITEIISSSYHPLRYAGNSNFILFKAMQHVPDTIETEDYRKLINYIVDKLPYNGLENLIDINTLQYIQLNCHHDNILDKEYITIIANWVDKILA